MTRLAGGRIVWLASGQVPGSRDPISEIVCSYGVPYVYLEALLTLLLRPLLPEKHVHYPAANTTYGRMKPNLRLISPRIWRAPMSKGAPISAACHFGNAAVKLIA